jgi:hypothetical protein
MRPFCMGRSAFVHAHLECLSDLPRTYICRRSLRLSFAVLYLQNLRVRRMHYRTCTLVLGQLQRVHTTILSSHTSACTRGAILAGQAEHLSTAEVLAVRDKQNIFPPRGAGRRLWSAFANKFLQRSFRAIVFHPRMWALNLRCSPSRHSSGVSAQCPRPLLLQSIALPGHED